MTMNEIEHNEIATKNLDASDEGQSIPMVGLTDADMKRISDAPNSAQKKRYPKPVQLTIESATAKRAEKLEGDTNESQFYRVKVILQYSDKSTEGLGGLRAYIDPVTKQIDRIWYSEKSAYGSIKKLLEDAVGAPQPLTLEQFVAELHGKIVRVRTQTQEVAGNKYEKNLPIEFVEVE